MKLWFRPTSWLPVTVGMTETSVRAIATGVTGGESGLSRRALTVLVAMSAACCGELPKWMTYLPAGPGEKWIWVLEGCDITAVGRVRVPDGGCCWNQGLWVGLEGRVVAGWMH